MVRSVLKTQESNSRKRFLGLETEPSRETRCFSVQGLKEEMGKQRYKSHKIKGILVQIIWTTMFGMENAEQMRRGSLVEASGLYTEQVWSYVLYWVGWKVTRQDTGFQEDSGMNWFARGWAHPANDFSINWRQLAVCVITLTSTGTVTSFEMLLK